MNKSIFWIFELSIKEGELDNFKKIMTEIVDSTKENEPNTLAYEWTINDEGTQCHIHERYADSEATLTHLKTFIEKYASRLMETSDVTRCVVYGNPNDELRTALGGFGAIYMSPIGGFIR